MKINARHNSKGSHISFAIALVNLINRGYNQKFRREPAALCCDEMYIWLAPDQFNVDETYYFAAGTSPDVERIVYAITTRSGMKGILVDAYGVYTDNISLEMFQKLRDGKEQPINIDDIKDGYNTEMISKKKMTGS